MTELATTDYPTWWRRMSRPQPPPTTWKYVFEKFTGDDSAREWGFAAALFIAQVGRRTPPDRPSRNSSNTSFPIPMVCPAFFPLR